MTCMISGNTDKGELERDKMRRGAGIWRERPDGRPDRLLTGSRGFPRGGVGLSGEARARHWASSPTPSFTSRDDHMTNRHQQNVGREMRVPSGWCFYDAYRSLPLSLSLSLCRGFCGLRGWQGPPWKKPGCPHYPLTSNTHIEVSVSEQQLCIETMN